MHKKDLIAYWLKSSDRDFQAMLHLLEKGDYTWSLFIGHLVLEKLLKAWYVQHIDNTPPFIHDLVRLAEKAALPLDEAKKIFWIQYRHSTFGQDMPIIKWNFIKNAQKILPKNGLKLSRS